MPVKVPASLLFVVVALSGAALPASSATSAASERALPPGVVASGDALSAHDHDSPFGGRTVLADWNPSPSTTIASLADSDPYRQPSQPMAPASHQSGLSARLAARAGNVESLAKVELGTSQWLALSVIVGLLGAARRRPAR